METETIEPLIINFDITLVLSFDNRYIISETAIKGFDQCQTRLPLIEVRGNHVVASLYWYSPTC